MTLGGGGGGGSGILDKKKLMILAWKDLKYTSATRNAINLSQDV